MGVFAVISLETSFPWAFHICSNVTLPAFTHFSWPDAYLQLYPVGGGVFDGSATERM